MEVSAQVVAWHDGLLLEARAWHELHPDFVFNVRRLQRPGKARLSAGYWFTGNNDYLFFAPFRPSDGNNKTRTIGFGIAFRRDGEPKESYLEIVFGGVENAEERRVYERIVAEFGDFARVGKDKYRRSYSGDPITSFRRFASEDYPRIRNAIQTAGAADRFFIAADDFNRMMADLETQREKAASNDRETAGDADTAGLSLLGTWSDVDAGDAERVQAAIETKGAWASWWSFPIREDFRDQLDRPFYVYLNAGGGNFPFRMLVERFESVRGNEGIPSPWPEITDEEWLDKRRMGSKTSEVCKTWFYVTEFEELRPALSLNDFEPAPDVNPAGLLNQSAFGYAYRRHAVAAPENADGPINLILYGPPGTGKTHWIRQKCAEYTDQPKNADWDTWLQEVLSRYGWRPVIAAALNEFGKPVTVPELRAHRWIAAKAKQRGRRPESYHVTIWGFLLEHTPENVTTVKGSVRRPPFIFEKLASSQWKLLPEWRELDAEAAELDSLLRAGPAGAREPTRRYRLVTFHPSFSYEDFIRGIRPVNDGEEGGATQFRLVDGIFKQICDEARANPSRRYALFIDEINRANIAKVFGELITLIERDKRAVFDADGNHVGGMVVRLPGGEGDEAGDTPFGVPRNLDIYGSMNTADRSIALLDIALRRRFEFRELEPDYSLLTEPVDGVRVDKLLERINDRLEFLLDRDHRIGHAYLMHVRSIEALRRVFRVQLIPLLQEYFFDDLSRVAAVLSTPGGVAPFIVAERLSSADLFPYGYGAQGQSERIRYRVAPEGSWTAASFQGVYNARGEQVDAAQAE